MNTIQLKYSSSINIVRDNDYSFHYIPTPNSTEAFERLLLNAKAGQKSQIIIGAYGTGKSSLLLAFQQTIKGSYNHFPNSNLAASKKYEFVPIVGDYSSIIKAFADAFNVKGNYTASDILKAIDKAYKQSAKKGKGLAFIIDEFGKFLEYASKNYPEAELYFLQVLAEWTNNTNTDALLVCTLHQDFNAYASILNKSQQQEWDKVKGRFKEILFNEPVEQLLFLASERLHTDTKQLSDTISRKLFDCISKSKAFPLRDYFTIEIAKKLYPLDILSSAILTRALQRYGQNERSLFSFLESTDSFSINYNGNSYYSTPQVYDYLLNTFYTTLTLNNRNSDYNQWSSIRKALEKLEGTKLQHPLQDAQQMVKTIGLLNLFASAGARLDDEFLNTYAHITLGIQQPKKILDELVGFKIIRYVNYNFRYTIAEGTDLNIDLAIDNAGRIVERVTSVVNQLQQYFTFPFIPAKAYYYKTGTPRLFKFILSEKPIIEVPEDDIDGFINLVFSSDANMADKIQETSHRCEEAILYAYYRNTTDIQNTLFEIQKIRKVIETNPDDKIAIKLLKDIEEYYTKLLNHQVMDSLYSENSNILWFNKGREVQVNSRQQFNQTLSAICDDVYRATPVFKNELINKTKISSQISVARKNITSRLLNNLHEENIGFPADKFPPEKTIYLSLLRENGIHKKVDNDWVLQPPTNQTFQALWKVSEAFLESTKGKQRNLQEFIDILLQKPLKLKRGFIDFWVPIFLLSKTDEYALFNTEGYIPALNKDIFELIDKKPSLFYIKAFDVAGIKLDLFNRYRVFLSQSESTKPDNKTFVQTIKPFLIFYKDLKDYAKKTQKISKGAIALRDVIAKAKDPEKAFFDDFPAALGYSIGDLQTKPESAEGYIKQMQEAIRELRTAYDELMNRFEHYITDTILHTQKVFPDYRDILSERYKNTKPYLLPAQYKSFYTRLLSPLDDRASWLNSLSQACIGKPLMTISDDEEAILYNKISTYFSVLDNLTDISNESTTEDESVIKLELTLPVQGSMNKIVRISKMQDADMSTKLSEIKTILGNDSQQNLAVLVTLLQEYLQHE